MNKIVNRRKSLLAFTLTFFLALGCLLLNPQEAKAFSVSSKYDTNRCFTSGCFYLYITNVNGTYSKIRVNVTRSKAPSYGTIQKGATSWTVKMDSGSRNVHNVRLSSSTVTTTKDINNQYFIMPIKFTYEMPAHYEYAGTVRRANRCELPRMDFQGENNDKATVNITGDHETAKSRRAGTAYVNLIQAGVATYSGDIKRYNGCEMQFQVERRTQTLKTKDWALGFTRGDLNAKLVHTNPASVNSSRSALVLKQNSVFRTYNCCTNVSARGLAVRSPKGYRQKDPDAQFNMGTKNRSVSLYQEPLNYAISYNLDGGTNHAANPKTYNVCYPVSFAAPTRKGSKFLGWYEGSKRITGINLGRTNGGLTTGNFYSQMNARTTGSKAITAKWDKPPVITSPIVKNHDNNKVAPFLKAIDGKNMLVIQKDDKFTAIKYQTARDEEDGDLTAKVKVLKNVPLVNGRATTSGRFDVTYQVTDSCGQTAAKTITVLVNDPPKPVVPQRYFFKEQDVTEEDLLAQVRIDDKEDGKTEPTKVTVTAIDDTGTTDLDTAEEGKRKVAIVVEDSLKGTAQGEFITHVVEDIQQANARSVRYPRFIDSDSIPSLGPNSIWMTDADYYGILAESLERDTPVSRYPL